MYDEEVRRYLAYLDRTAVRRANPFHDEGRLSEAMEEVRWAHAGFAVGQHGLLRPHTARQQAAVLARYGLAE